MYPLVYFVRHGLTEWNAEGRFQGQVETDLSEIGRMQADRNGQLLAELIPEPKAFDFVSSPMRRTRATMEHVRKAMGLPPQEYCTDARLIELNFGTWQGFTLPELEATAPGSNALRLRDKWRFLPPGDEAESYEMLARRVAPVIAAMDKPTVCVTHGGVVRCIFHLVEGMPGDEAAGMLVPQDQVLELRDGKLSWR